MSCRLLILLVAISALSPVARAIRLGEQTSLDTEAFLGARVWLEARTGTGVGADCVTNGDPHVHVSGKNWFHPQVDGTLTLYKNMVGGKEGLKIQTVQQKRGSVAYNVGMKIFYRGRKYLDMNVNQGPPYNYALISSSLTAKNPITVSGNYFRCAAGVDCGKFEFAQIEGHARGNHMNYRLRFGDNPDQVTGLCCGKPPTCGDGHCFTAGRIQHDGHFGYRNVAGCTSECNKDAQKCPKVESCCKRASVFAKKNNDADFERRCKEDGFVLCCNGNGKDDPNADGAKCCGEAIEADCTKNAQNGCNCKIKPDGNWEDPSVQNNPKCNCCTCKDNQICGGAENAGFCVAGPDCNGKKCQCTNGNPTSGLKCPVHNEVHCDSCFKGFRPLGDKECAQNKCRCNNGQVATGDKCNEHNAEICTGCNGGFHQEGKTCQPNTCKCDDGKAKTGAACATHNDHDCASCNRGFHPEGKLCKKNKCSCKNGKGHEGGECDAHNTEKCKQCDNGFYKNGKQCNQNECKCTNGKGAKGTGCPKHNDETCQQCNEGFNLGGDKRCGKNKCTCQNGQGFKGINCKQHKTPQCEKCNKGFHLEGKDCKPNVCTCDNGEAKKGAACTEHNSERCSRCAEGFHKEGERCVVNVCGCPNGTPAEGKDCATHEATICAKCDATFWVNGNKKCKPNVCRCQNGEPVAQEECTKNSEWKCKSCQNAFHLDAFKCNKNVCKCENGTPAAGEACDEHDVENCASCPDGFTLDGASCEENQCDCDNGKPATGKACPKMDAPKCEDCDEGFYKTPKGVCEEKFCKCKNGKGAQGVACPNHNDQKCDECEDGFHMAESKCEPNVCKCPNGKATREAACPKHDMAHCGDCNEGFRNVNGQCQQNECQCRGGTPVTGKKCHTHTAFICESCPEHHKNTGAACVVDPNACTCTDGEAATGEKCTAKVVELKGAVCVDCNEGFHLAESKCEKNECVCPCGVPVAAEECVAHKSIMCATCGEGSTPISYEDWADEDATEAPKEAPAFLFLEKAAVLEREWTCEDAGKGSVNGVCGGKLNENKCLHLYNGGCYADTKEECHALDSKKEEGCTQCGMVWCDDNGSTEGPIDPSTEGPTDPTTEDPVSTEAPTTESPEKKKCKADREKYADYTKIVVCEDNECTCENGKAAKGEQCQATGEVCTECEAGHTLQPDGSCSKNVCKCPGGKEAEGAACTEDEAHMCTECNAGYTLDAETKECTKNECKCPNGHPALDEDCKTDGALICARCHEGHSGVECKKNECKCENGKVPDVCPEDGAAICEEPCNKGFTLANGSCDQNECTCENGTPATGAECTEDNGEICVECEEGYKLDVETGLCLLTLFDDINTNDDGCITRAEFDQAFKTREVQDKVRNVAEITQKVGKKVPKEPVVLDGARPAPEEPKKAELAPAPAPAALRFRSSGPTLFDHVDANHDQKVTREELSSAFKTAAVQAKVRAVADISRQQR